MKKIFVQCLKELSQFKRDRLTLALAFVLPFMTLLIFGFAIRLESKNIPIYIQDFSLTPLSRAYIERLLATNQFRRIDDKFLSKYSGQQPDILIAQGLAKVAVIIPPDFSKKIKSNSPSFVQILVDGSDVNNARLIKNSIQATTFFFLQYEGLQTSNNNLTAHLRIWFNPGRQEHLYIIPGLYGLILWTYPSLLAAIAMIREKTEGTIVQVYSSAITATEFILGKSFAYLFIGILEAVFIMVCGLLIWKLKLVIDPTTLLLGTIIFLFNSTLYGIFIGIRAPNQTAAIEAVAMTGFLTALLLSGFIYPINNIPFPLSLISYLIPTRYYIEISRDAYVRGIGWSGVWLSLLILTLWGIIVFYLTYQLIKKMQFKN